ncbi:MAG: hypothetical protein RLZZ385_1630 [Pseudomonadota bacterium]|jgi:hypothetical protein
MAKVIARLMGGLGNQLFIYSAARRLALHNAAELVLDDVSGFARDTLYRRRCELQHFAIAGRFATSRERLEPLPRLRRAWRLLNENRKPFARRRHIVQQGVDFVPDLLQLKVPGTLYLEGYWQSEGYFADVADTIRGDLRILPPQDTANLEMAQRIRHCPQPVAVHLRYFLGDAVDHDQHAPPDYYRRALALLEQHIADSHYFVFSDRPDLVQAAELFPAGRFTVVDHNQGHDLAYADLWLMTLCRHFIIANSTFSWWGAWLPSHSNKIVIAPGIERREGVAWWGFKGLIPHGWITC